MDSQQDVYREADSTNPSARSDAWRPFVLGVLGMASFWQLLRYRNLSALVPFWTDPASGVPGGYGALLLLVGLGCIASGLDGGRLVRLVRKSRFLAVSALLSSGCALLGACTQGFTTLGATWAPGLQVACIPLYAATFIGLLVGWSDCLARFLPDSKGIALVVLVSSAVTLVYTLASSFEVVASYAVRAAQPALCALFLVLLVRRHTDSQSPESRPLAQKPAYRALVFCCMLALLVAASVVKGVAGNSPGNFIDSPHLLYSQLVTLAFGIVALVALLWARNSTAFVYASLVILAGCLVLGLLTLGFAAPEAYPLASALVVADRAWVEALLFGAAVCAGPANRAVRRACLGFGLPDLLSSLIRRVAIPWFASEQGASFEELAPSWSVGLGIGVLAGCCALLAWSVLVRANSSAGQAPFEFAPTGGLVPIAIQASGAADAAAALSASAALAQRYGLTPKESVILDRLLRGYSIPDIAERESVSESTVRTHYRNIYAKLDIHSKTELIELAEQWDRTPAGSESGSRA